MSALKAAGQPLLPARHADPWHFPWPNCCSYSLPGGNTATIGLIGDWGTGMPQVLATRSVCAGGPGIMLAANCWLQALDMLTKIQSYNKPSVLVHLGDVYYGGSTSEQTANQYS